MDEKYKISILRFIREKGTENHEVIKKAFPSKTENAYDYLQILKSENYVKCPSPGMYEITDKGSTFLNSLDEDLRTQRTKDKLNIDLFNKQSKFIDEQIPLVQEQYRYYKKFKWIPIIISIVSVLISALSLYLSILIRNSKY